LDKQPEMLPQSMLYWRAFSALSAQRGHTEGGPSPLTVEAMIAWAAFNDVIPDADLYLRFISILDHQYLAHEHKRLAAQRKKESRRGASKAPSRRK
jgi:hypothetical protein